MRTLIRIFVEFFYFSIFKFLRIKETSILTHLSQCDEFFLFSSLTSFTSFLSLYPLPTSLFIVFFFFFCIFFFLSNGLEVAVKKVANTAFLTYVLSRYLWAEEFHDHGQTLYVQKPTKNTVILHSDFIFFSQISVIYFLPFLSSFPLFFPHPVVQYLYISFQKIIFPTLLSFPHLLLKT